MNYVFMNLTTLALTKKKKKNCSKESFVQESEHTGEALYF